MRQRELITTIENCRSCGKRHTNVKVVVAIEPGIATHVCPLTGKGVEA